MNQAALFFVFMTLSSLSQHSMAGNGSGGGGFAITCRSAQGKIERAELLDLYEARTIFNRTLIASNGNTKDDYLAAVKNMKTLRSDAPSVESASITFDGYYKAFEFVKAGKVPKMNDMGEVPPAPTGCRYL